jgi:hypothetical protein
MAAIIVCMLSDISCDFGTSEFMNIDITKSGGGSHLIL